MDLLFPDLHVPDLPRFTQPTTREITAWLRDTEGVWSNELLRWLGRPEVSERIVMYTGPLSLAQQWIVCELLDQT